MEGDGEGRRMEGDGEGRREPLFRADVNLLG